MRYLPPCLMTTGRLMSSSQPDVLLGPRTMTGFAPGQAVLALHQGDALLRPPGEPHAVLAAPSRSTEMSKQVPSEPPSTGFFAYLTQPARTGGCQAINRQIEDTSCVKRTSWLSLVSPAEALVVAQATRTCQWDMRVRLSQRGAVRKKKPPAEVCGLLAPSPTAHPGQAIQPANLPARDNVGEGQAVQCRRCLDPKAVPTRSGAGLGVTGILERPADGRYVQLGCERAALRWHNAACKHDTYLQNGQS